MVTVVTVFCESCVGFHHHTLPSIISVFHPPVWCVKCIEKAEREVDCGVVDGFVKGLTPW